MEMQEVTPRWLSLQDAATYTGLSVSALRNMIRDGQLRASRPSRRIILDIRELDKMMKMGEES